MSTFLVSLGVIVAVVASVTWLALSDPEQRATERRPTRRARRQRDQRERSRRPQVPAAVFAPSVPEATAARTPVSLFPQVIAAPVNRARAGLALTVLVTFVGVTLALSIAGGIFFVAEGLRATTR